MTRPLDLAGKAIQVAQSARDYINDNPARAIVVQDVQLLLQEYARLRAEEYARLRAEDDARTQKENATMTDDYQRCYDEGHRRGYQNGEVMRATLENVKNLYKRYLDDAVADQRDIVDLADDAIDRLYFALRHALQRFDYDEDDEVYDLTVQWAEQATKRWYQGTAELRRDNTDQATDNTEQSKPKPNADR